MLKSLWSLESLEGLNSPLKSEELQSTALNSVVLNSTAINSFALNEFGEFSIFKNHKVTK